jgi:hypothetical protein
MSARPSYPPLPAAHPVRARRNLPSGAAPRGDLRNPLCLRRKLGSVRPPPPPPLARAAVSSGASRARCALRCARALPLAAAREGAAPRLLPACLVRRSCAPRLLARARAAWPLRARACRLARAKASCATPPRRARCEAGARAPLRSLLPSCSGLSLHLPRHAASRACPRRATHAPSASRGARERRRACFPAPAPRRARLCARRASRAPSSALAPSTYVCALLFSLRAPRALLPPLPRARAAPRRAPRPRASAPVYSAVCPCRAPLNQHALHPLERRRAQCPLFPPAACPRRPSAGPRGWGGEPARGSAARRRCADGASGSRLALLTGARAPL